MTSGAEVLNNSKLRKIRPRAGGGSAAWRGVAWGYDPTLRHARKVGHQSVSTVACGVLGARGLQQGRFQRPEMAGVAIGSDLPTLSGTRHQLPTYKRFLIHFRTNRVVDRPLRPTLKPPLA